MSTVDIQKGRSHTYLTTSVISDLELRLVRGKRPVSAHLPDDC